MDPRNASVIEACIPLAGGVYGLVFGLTSIGEGNIRSKKKLKQFKKNKRILAMIPPFLILWGLFNFVRALVTSP